jgi:hypothetical protein
MSEIPMDLGLAADLDQEQRAREARGHPAADFEPVGENLEDTMASVARAKEAFDRKKLRVLEQDCARCDNPDSTLARHCGFRGEQECGHATEFQARGRRKTLETNLRTGKVPEAHWRAILAGDIDGLPAVAAVRRVLAGEVNLVILGGTPDSGKSFAAALAVAERGGYFMDASVLDQFPNKIDNLLKHCREIPLLAIDDVGSGRSTSQVAAPQLEGLVRERFDRERPTILTTNLTREQFWPFYGGDCGRMANRAGSAGWVRCLEKARRRNGGAR